MAKRAIQFTPSLVKELREAYDEAVAQDKQQFRCLEHDWRVDYTRYLLEYLEGLRLPE